MISDNWRNRLRTSPYIPVRRRRQDSDWSTKNSARFWLGDVKMST